MRRIIPLFVLFFLFARTASAAVSFNEIQIAPINGRFIELYNPDSSDVDLTGWYIQRQTATGSTFGSSVTSTQFNGKIIKAHNYFLISRSQLENSDIVFDSLTLTESNTVRIKDSKGKDIDQIGWGSVDEGKSYQKTSAGQWVISTPTPGKPNANVAGTAAQTVSTNSNTAPATTTAPASSGIDLSSFPVEPQIFTKISAQAKTISVGATTVFTGRVWGLKKEPIENAQMTWALGDGATSKGASVSHIYYYPGEYTIVLDSASGYYSASDRVRIVAVVPTLALHTGGDNLRSFVGIENVGNDELDLSEWQVVAQGKIFTLPKNTTVGAHKTLTLASEVSALVTPADTNVSLRFPNGMLVPIQQNNSVVPVIKSEPTSNVPKTVPAPATETRVLNTRTSTQAANTLDSVSDTTLTPEQGAQEQSPWMWYVGIAFLGVLGAIGLRFGRKNKPVSDAPTADDFEIIEEEDEL